MADEQKSAKESSDNQDPLAAPLDLPPDTHPANHSPKKRSRWPIQKFVRWGLVLLVIAVLAAAGWKIFGDKKSTSPSTAATTPTNSNTTQSNSKTSDVSDATGTKDFEYGPLGITLTHPSTWTASETSDMGVRVTSPDFNYQTIDKGILTGNFRIYIRKGARSQDSKYIGRGVAIQPSEKLKYTSPAPGQRTETSVSFFGLDQPDNFAFFLIAGNFNLQKGDTLGPNYGKETETYIISGGYSAKDLTDDMATNMVSTDSFAKTKAYKQALDIIESIKLQ